MKIEYAFKLEGKKRAGTKFDSIGLLNLTRHLGHSWGQQEWHGSSSYLMLPVPRDCSQAVDFFYFWLNFGLQFDTVSFKLISNTADALGCKINSSKAKPCPPALMFSPYLQTKHSQVVTTGRDTAEL